MTPETPGGQARIIDRGYQHYAGPRLGQWHALWTMTRAAATRSMGFRRSLSAGTVLKWLLAAVPLLAAIIVAVVLANARSGQNVAYTSMFQGLELVYVLFAALVAPDLVCTDRRERVLSLYFAAPISRALYVGAQALGLAALMALLVIVPMILLFFVHAALSDSLAGYVRDNAMDIAHLLLAGLVITVYYTALALATAALNDRRAYAAGTFLGLLLLTSAAAAIISRGMHFSNHQWIALGDLLSAPVRVARWILGSEPEAAQGTYTPRASGGAYLLVCGAVTALSALLLWARYSRAEDR